MSRRVSLFGRSLLLGTLALGLAGCSTVDGLFGSGEQEVDPGALRQNIEATAGTAAAAVPGARVGVNAFLWRASLDTLTFMPIVQADPYGGVVLTDWYSPPGTTGERFRVNLLILDAALRADGVRATVFRQVLDPQGNWRDAAVSPETGTQLENSILTRARQLRVASSPK